MFVAFDLRVLIAYQTYQINKSQTASETNESLKERELPKMAEPQSKADRELHHAAVSSEMPLTGSEEKGDEVIQEKGRI